MRFKIFMLFFILPIIFCGCQKPESKDVSVESVMEKILPATGIDNPREEDLTKQEVAEKYGISPDDLAGGIGYEGSSHETPDKIILLKAKDREVVEDLERSISNEIIALTNSWKDDEEHSEKFDKIIFKTKDVFILMYVGSNEEEVEKIFDENV